MKVLVITLQYAPDYGPSAPIYTALCEDLARKGYSVSVITAFPNYLGSGCVPSPSKKLFEEESRNGVRVIRTRIYNAPKSCLWKRLFSYASFNLLSSLIALGVGKQDIIVADAPTLWSGLPLMLKAIIPGVPFIYVLHDIYPDVLLKLGILRNPCVLDLIARIENFYYKQSVQVSVLSEGFRQNLLYKGIPDEKITIIPACVDTEFVQPLPCENKFREDWGLKGKIVVLYAGNMGFSQGLEIVLQAAKLLIDHPEIVFVLVGDGATKPELQAIANELHLPNVMFFPFQPCEDVPSVYALADISLVSLRSKIVESVPSKTYTILASGRPVVATVEEGTEVDILIKQAQCGFCVKAENPELLAKAILMLYQNPCLRSEMGNHGRQYVKEHYSRQVASCGYEAIILRYAVERAN